MSTETKFTKGAWVAGRIEVNGVAIDKTWAVGVNGCTLANVTSGPTFGIINEIQKANAQLIAAAPEMYKALNRFYDALLNVDAFSDETNALGNLLAKARGESI
jgi:hypothetical protein